MSFEDIEVARAARTMKEVVKEASDSNTRAELCCP